MIDIRVADKMALSTEEAAWVANVGVVTLRRAINDGTLRAHKSGRRMIILRADLESWLQQLPVAGVAENRRPAEIQK
jgi:excisionase family DNA binding protein